LSPITIIAVVVLVVVHCAVTINVFVVAIIVVVHRAIVVVVILVAAHCAVTIVVVDVVLHTPLPSSSLSLPVASSPSLSSKPLSVAIVIVDAVIRCAVAIIVDVHRTVAIVVDAVARCAVTIVDNGKMPVHWQRQRCHHDKGNNTITATAKTPVHRQQ
jgi:hypothetical protein